MHFRWRLGKGGKVEPLPFNFIFKMKKSGVRGDIIKGKTGRGRTSMLFFVKEELSVF